MFYRNRFCSLGCNGRTQLPLRVSNCTYIHRISFVLFHICACRYRELIRFRRQAVVEFTPLLLRGWMLDFSSGVLVSRIGKLRCPTSWSVRMLCTLERCTPFKFTVDAVQRVAVTGVLPAKSRSISSRDLPSVSGSRK